MTVANTAKTVRPTHGHLMLDHFGFVLSKLVSLSLVSSSIGLGLPSQEIGWEERLRNEWDVKPYSGTLHSVSVFGPAIFCVYPLSFTV